MAANNQRGNVSVISAAQQRGVWRIVSRGALALAGVAWRINERKQRRQNESAWREAAKASEKQRRQNEKEEKGSERKQ